MNNVSKKLCLILASAVLVFAGCSKKPSRPSPDQTVLGQKGGGPDVLYPGLENPPPDLANRTEGTIGPDGVERGVLEAVYFEFNQSNIRESERPKLQAAKDYLDKNPGKRILLEGHCDWRGTAEYNLGLGDRRANAAKKYLQSLGVSVDRIETTSKGSLEAKPNATDAETAKDRRVELGLIKAAQ
jgi:peptidoglycan-associated lipoprotein